MLVVEQVRIKYSERAPDDGQDGWRLALFNLATDPGETNNLIEGLPEIAGTLRRKLAAWEVEVASPRLRDFPG